MNSIRQKSILTLLTLSILLCQTVSLRSADTKVKAISNERIEATIAELRASDQLRSRIRWTTLAASLAATGFLAYRLWATDEKDHKIDPVALNNSPFSNRY